jgi:Ala-tRNA(Pro) deacylase
MAGRAELLQRLETLGIASVTTDHPAVFTVEEATATHHAIPGVHCKNLFLKDAKDQLWLVVCPHDREVEMKSLHKRIGSKRLSFGKADLLWEVLGVRPGSVTPFALINDRDHRVKVVLDAWMMDQETLNYHPLENTATTTVSNADLLRFIADCGHEPQVVDLVAPLEAEA